MRPDHPGGRPGWLLPGPRATLHRRRATPTATKVGYGATASQGSTLASRGSVHRAPPSSVRQGRGGRSTAAGDRRRSRVSMPSLTAATSGSGTPEVAHQDARRLSARSRNAADTPPADPSDRSIASAGTNSGGVEAMARPDPRLRNCRGVEAHGASGHNTRTSSCGNRSARPVPEAHDIEGALLSLGLTGAKSAGTWTPAQIPPRASRLHWPPRDLWITGPSPLAEDDRVPVRTASSTTSRPGASGCLAGVAVPPFQECLSGKPFCLPG